MIKSELEVTPEKSVGGALGNDGAEKGPNMTAASSGSAPTTGSTVTTASGVASSVGTSVSGGVGFTSAGTTTTSTGGGAHVTLPQQSVRTTTPKDGQVITTILKEMGITEFEPRVIHQLLEFTYRYVTSVLDDAQIFSHYAKKKTIDGEDVRLAIQLQVEKMFTSPPPRELLLDIARSKNSQALPPIKSHAGPRLPPDRYSLVGCNFKLKSGAKLRSQQSGGDRGAMNHAQTPYRSGTSLLPLSSGYKNRTASMIAAQTTVNRPSNVNRLINNNPAAATPPTQQQQKQHQSTPAGETTKPLILSSVKRKLDE